MVNTRVKPALLRVHVDPEVFAFATTAEHHAPEGAAAHDRALAAISFWAAARGTGFNLFATGPSGIGRRAAIRAVIQGFTGAAEPFDDWVYVNNFQDPHQPCALRLPFGSAVPFRDAMVELIEDLAGAVPAAFEADDYKTRRNALEATQESEQEDRLAKLRDRAAEQSIALIRTPMGFAFVPTRDGEVIKPDVFNTWPAADREDVQQKVENLQEELETLIKHDMPALERDTRTRIRELDREVAKSTIELAISEVAKKFPGIAPIQDHLAEISRDLIQHFHLFMALAQAGDEVAWRNPISRALQ